MEIIDAQIHEPSVSLEWSNAGLDMRREVLSEVMLAYLDAVGVDAALLHAKDQEWAEQMIARFPRRFASVFRANHVAEEPDVEERIADTKRKHSEGLLAWRVVIGMPLTGEEIVRYKAGVYERIFAACEKNELPLFFFATRHLYAAAEVAERYPDLVLILDHLGIPQPPFDTRDSPTFKNLPELLRLASHPNVYIKFAGAPGLSVEEFPYADLWPHLRRIVDAFGSDRLMWGTDISRFDGRIGFERRPIPDKYSGKHNYSEALHYLLDTGKLSPSEKESILGGTLRRVLGWKRIDDQP